MQKCRNYPIILRAFDISVPRSQCFLEHPISAGVAGLLAVLQHEVGVLSALSGLGPGGAVLVIVGAGAGGGVAVQAEAARVPAVHAHVTPVLGALSFTRPGGAVGVVVRAGCNWVREWDDR